MSNTANGAAFEKIAEQWFQVNRSVVLASNFKVDIGFKNQVKKPHRFDLGANNPSVLVECKCHEWTSSGNIPSAKLTIWNEAMFFFLLAPAEFKKYFFVKRHLRNATGETLLDYYLRNYNHLVPKNVEVIEYDVGNTRIFQWDSASSRWAILKVA